MCRRELAPVETRRGWMSVGAVVPLVVLALEAVLAIHVNEAALVAPLAFAMLVELAEALAVFLVPLGEHPLRR